MTKSIKKGLVVLLLVAATGAMLTVASQASAGLRLTPRKLRFEVPAGGSISQPQMVKIFNSGPAITGLSIGFTGPAAADFQKDLSLSDCTTDLGAGANCTVAMTFAPTSLKPGKARLAVGDGTNSSAGTVTLSGLSLQPPVSSESVNFGRVQLGKTSAPKTVTVSNPNSVAVNIESITTSGPFAVKGETCGSSLAAGASCSISVTFTPNSACNTAGGLETGDLSIRNDASVTPRRTKLSGIAVNKLAKTAIFVTNYLSNAVTAYQLSGGGNLTPISNIGDPLGLNQPVGVALDSSGKIYVVNQQDSSVVVYAACPNGAVAPIAAIRGTNTGLNFPANIALDSSGKIYVSNSTPSFNGSVAVYPPLGSSTGNLNEKPIANITGANTGLIGPYGIALDSSGKIYVVDELQSVLVYPPLGSKKGTLNEAPTATIAGATTSLDAPFGIALDSSGKIYVTNQLGGPSDTGTVTIYAPLGSSTGTLDEAPIATLVSDTFELFGPSGIALDSGGNIYVANDSNPGSVTVYPPLGSGTGTLDEAPTASIGGDNTGLAQSDSIAFDSGGNIYVANLLGGPSSAGSVTVYPPLGSSTGILDEAPTATIGTSLTGINAAFGIVLDSSGNIYVANEDGGPADLGSVTVYTAGSKGNVAPTATITSGNLDTTGLLCPYGIALDSVGNIYVANFLGGPSSLGSITIYPPLGSSTGVLDETPIATISAPDSGSDNTGLHFPSGVALDSTGNIYVANYGGGLGGSITVYPPLGSSTGSLNEAPTLTVIGADTGLVSPQGGITLDSSGNMYVPNCIVGCGGSGNDTVTIFPPLGSSTGTLDEAPIATISGSNTRLGAPEGVAVDSDENIYVTNDGISQGSISTVTVYRPLGSRTGILDEAPIASIMGSKTLLAAPHGIAIGPFVPGQ